MARATKPKSQPDWSSLPTSLLTSIAERLPTQIDVRRYRAVCTTFHSSITLSPDPRIPYPNLKIPVTMIPELDVGHKHLLLTQTYFYAIEPLTNVSNARKTTKPWILRVEEFSGNKISLEKPFCRMKYRNMHNKLPESLNLLDYGVKELGKIYGLASISNDDIYDEVAGVKKVVLSDDGSAVMALTDGGAIVVWRDGNDDCTEIHVDDSECSAEDIIYHNGKFYAIYCHPDVLVKVDSVSLAVQELKLRKIRYDDTNYLVKSLNDLFLVSKRYGPDYWNRVFVKYDRKKFSPGENYPIEFSVYKFDEVKNKFIKANNAFKDRVVFLGDDFAFTVSAKEFPGLKRNCVYFEDHVFGNPEDYLHPVLEAGVFDFRNNTARPLCASTNNIFWSPPSWLMTPPAWLVTNSRSDDA